MIRQITCECGYVARHSTDDGVVELTEAHIAADHPALSGSVSPADIRGWIELVPN
jgi:hypothetical protein